jgi:hypothetical protein
MLWMIVAAEPHAKAANVSPLYITIGVAHLICGFMRLIETDKVINNLEGEFENRKLKEALADALKTIRHDILLRQLLREALCRLSSFPRYRTTKEKGVEFWDDHEYTRPWLYAQQILDLTDKEHERSNHL